MGADFSVYEFHEILKATNNFSEENKLGQGGFGPVYKVWCLLQPSPPNLGQTQKHRRLQLRVVFF
jgi:hypothetical protein